MVNSQCSMVGWSRPRGSPYTSSTTWRIRHSPTLRYCSSSCGALLAGICARVRGAGGSAVVWSGSGCGGGELVGQNYEILLRADMARSAFLGVL